MNRLKILLLVPTLLLNSLLFAQAVNYDEVYQKSKLLLDNGGYRDAVNGFKSLLDIDPANPKSPYSTFFYGVALYQLNELESAKDAFLQLNRKYNDWGKMPEVYLWLSKIHFEIDSPNQGIYYANLAQELPSEANEIKGQYLSELKLVDLYAIFETTKEEPLVAKFLAEKLVAIPALERDNELVEELITDYDLDSTELGLTPPKDIFKEKYNVAVMLPLFTERLWQSGIYLQKSFAVDIYEGIKMAWSEFDTTKISLTAFDTKMDASITENILESGQLKEVDAVIGPLYPKTLELVSDYCENEKLNFLNPVSTNSELIRYNPYAFLLRTGAESMGTILADYVKNKLDTGAFAVYYGPRETDSLAAYNYSTRMEADSFYLAIRQRTDTEKARQIFDSLTSSFEVVDSVALRRMWRDQERVRFLPLKDSLRLKVDSLNHIFIASDNQAIASEVMSAITSRGDTTQLIGVGNWYSTPNASLALMESLGVWLAMQEFENMLSPLNLEISEKYRMIHRSAPSKYVFYGYYAMKAIGESLLNYGVYFQNGYKRDGNINRLFNYARSQDNHRLVLYRLKEGKPELMELDKLLK